MLWILAWRNVWRNKGRTTLLLLSIALGLCAGLLSSALSMGMGKQMVDSGIRSQVSHVQVHHPDFRVSQELNDTILGFKKIENGLAQWPHVVGWTARLRVPAIAASPHAAAGVSLVGVPPDQEKNVTDISEHLVDGSYLTGEWRHPVLIGYTLAGDLGVGVGDKLVLTFQDAEANLSGAAFRVGGIFKTVSSMYDKSHVFVNIQDLAVLLQLQGRYHEVAVLLSSAESVDSIRHKLQVIAPYQKVSTWNELAPELAYIAEAFDYSLWIFMGIIWLALAFGIVNAMLMAVLERRRELAMLLALGMVPQKIFYMIACETLMVSGVGAVVGSLLAAGGVQILKYTGLSLSVFSEGLGAWGIAEVIYPVLPWHWYALQMIMAMVTAFIAALYPAYIALKMNTVEDLRVV